MDMHLLPERPCLPANTVTSLALLVRLTAPVLPRANRKPLNLCLVIDRSGSMAGEKLRQTVAAAQYVIRRLAPRDVLSVVQFDERVQVVIAPRPVQDAAHLCALLARLRPGGATNLSGGWLRGAACLRAYASPEYVNRVLLLTDGRANHGVTDPPVLIRHAAELTEEGIATTTLGYGDDFQEDLLTALADAGRGNAYHVATADQAPGIFAQELEGLLAVAAQNVRVTLQPQVPGCAIDLLTEQAHRRTPRGLTVPLGDLVSAEERRLVFNLRVPAVAGADRVVLASVGVAYEAVGAGIQPRQETQDLLLGIVPAEQAAALPAEARVRRALLVLRAARVLRHAIARADAGDVPGALQHLQGFLGLPEVAQATAPDIRAARRRVQDYLRQLASEGYTRANRKQMAYSSYRWTRGQGTPSAA
ncbi:MAG: VWA domain-containing protein [Candidatus Methylomirabilales bacterium]